MTLCIGTPCPNFSHERLGSALTFHQWKGAAWAVIFAVKAFSPTCTTEIVSLHAHADRFDKLGIKLLVVAIESEADVAGWREDMTTALDCTPVFPLLADVDHQIARTLDLLDTAAAVPALFRAALVVGPEGKIASMLTYSVTNGRNIDELLRNVEGMQLTHDKRVATGADWRPGAPVMLPPSLSQDDAERAYPSGVEVIRPYLRYVAQPK